ncbi:hypothetical protein CN390_04290 [Bacillus cereus]|nr:hypothetical protein CN390_04290 [Bacillus cereus]
MTEKVTCPYCKELVESSTSELEHVVPEGLGSPILNPNVCNKCNAEASVKIDGPYFNNTTIKILQVVTGTKTKKGILKPMTINTIFNPQGIKLKIEKAKFSFIGDMSEKSTIKLFDRYALDDFKAVSASLKDKSCSYEHAKLFLGLLSMCVPEFVTSKTADTLREIMWHGTRPELDLPNGEKIHGDMFGELLKNITDSDGPDLYKNRHHIIRIQGNANGSIHAYIDLYNTLRPNILTLEKKEEWKKINIRIMIDPEIKKVVKYEGITKIDLTKQYPKYENGCRFEIN